MLKSYIRRNLTRKKIWSRKNWRMYYNGNKLEFVSRIELAGLPPGHVTGSFLTFQQDYDLWGSISFRNPDLGSNAGTHNYRVWIKISKRLYDFYFFESDFVEVKTESEINSLVLLLLKLAVSLPQKPREVLSPLRRAVALLNCSGLHSGML